ncbi:hypothetical protein OH77DRAFT_855689 [Trametes cingulata]|nr:hypothetical protein OH77DRAFT_855689 [Trametes cingulata]
MPTVDPQRPACWRLRLSPAALAERVRVLCSVQIIPSLAAAAVPPGLGARRCSSGKASSVMYAYTVESSGGASSFERRYRWVKPIRAIRDVRQLLLRDWTGKERVRVRVITPVHGHLGFVIGDLPGTTKGPADSADSAGSAHRRERGREAVREDWRGSRRD